MKNDAFDTLYDDEEDDFDRDIKYFRNVGSFESPEWVYFGDVSRAEDIDIFSFWAKHMPQMPSAGPITEMMGQPASSSLAESLFSYGRYVLGDYRLALLPERSERLILSAANFKSKSLNKSLPKLPTTGEIDDEDHVIDEMDTEFEVRAANVMQEEFDEEEEDNFFEI
jgi:hypothetical protein